MEYLHPLFDQEGAPQATLSYDFFYTTGTHNFNRSQRKYKLNITDVVKGLSGRIIVLFIVRQPAAAAGSQT